MTGHSSFATRRRCAHVARTVAVAIAFAGGVAAVPAHAAPPLPGGAEVIVEPDSVRMMQGWSGVGGAWVRFNYTMSIDCSPPRACYARSQRIYYLVNCSIVAMSEVQRVSLDLNGGVVAQSEPDFNGPWYRPLGNSTEALALNNVCLRFLQQALPVGATAY
jgi:hypothetical protein